MLDTFPTPVLTITDAVDDLEGVEALSSLYTLVSKCKAGLKDGQRLENLSWRLWYRLEKMPTTLTTLRPPLTDPRTHSIKGDNPTNSNALAASAYQSPAPSVASIYSPSPSTISFSDSSISIGSSNDSDSGSERSLRDGQQQPLPRKQEERVEQGDSQQQRGQQVQQQQQNETEPHDHHRAISGHIPSPITSPSPSPCPSSPTTSSQSQQQLPHIPSTHIPLRPPQLPALQTESQSAQSQSHRRPPHTNHHAGSNAKAQTSTNGNGNAIGNGTITPPPLLPDDTHDNTVGVVGLMNGDANGSFRMFNQTDVGLGGGGEAGRKGGVDGDGIVDLVRGVVESYLASFDQVERIAVLCSAYEDDHHYYCYCDIPTANLPTIKHISFSLTFNNVNIHDDVTVHFYLYLHVNVSIDTTRSRGGVNGNLHTGLAPKVVIVNPTPQPTPHPTPPATPTLTMASGPAFVMSCLPDAPPSASTSCSTSTAAGTTPSLPSSSKSKPITSTSTSTGNSTTTIPSTSIIPSASFHGSEETRTNGVCGVDTEVEFSARCIPAVSSSSPSNASPTPSAASPSATRSSSTLMPLGVVGEFSRGDNPLSNHNASGGSIGGGKEMGGGASGRDGVITSVDGVHGVKVVDGNGNGGVDRDWMEKERGRVRGDGEGKGGARGGEEGGRGRVLAVPDHEQPPGKPPSFEDTKMTVHPNSNSNANTNANGKKPVLSVDVGEERDKERTLRPSDRRFFLLQSPEVDGEERSPDSVRSMSLTGSVSRSLSASGGGRPGGGVVRFQESPEPMLGAGLRRGGEVEKEQEKDRVFDDEEEDIEEVEEVEEKPTKQAATTATTTTTSTTAPKKKERSLSRDSTTRVVARNRSVGMLSANKRSGSTTSLGGATRVRAKGLGLGGGLTMTKSKVGHGVGHGLAHGVGHGQTKAAGLKRSMSGGVVVGVAKAITNANDDIAKNAKTTSPLPPQAPPSALPRTVTAAAASPPSPAQERLHPSSPLHPKDATKTHRASFNIGSGSSESRSGEGSTRGTSSGHGDGVRGGGGGVAPKLGGDGVAGGMGKFGDSTTALAGLSRLLGGTGGAINKTLTNKSNGVVTQTHHVASPPSTGRLPNPATLALDPDAANAALQPSRKKVVLSTTSSEDYETTDLDDDDEEEVEGDEDGSWASSEDEEITFARGGQNQQQQHNGNGGSAASKRGHARGGSVGGRKGRSSSHSRGVGSTKGKVKSPAQPPVKAPQAQRTKSDSPAVAQQQHHHQQQQPHAPPPLARRHTSHVMPRRRLSKEDEAALKLEAAAVEAQRQRDLFTKIPVQPRGPGGVQRTQSGLLSQLLNPDPTIFPPNHPYRQTYSAVDLRRRGNVPRVVMGGGGGVGAPQRFMVVGGDGAVAPSSSVADVRNANANGDAQPPPANQRTHQSRPSNPLMPKAPMVGSFRAAPVAVTQVSVVNGVGGSGAYRPKGRPQGQELEDETDTDGDADNSIQVSKSYAQKKLAELAGRRTTPTNGKQQQHAPARPPLVRALTTSEAVATGSTSALGMPTLVDTLSPPPTAPVLLAHPYNLPPAGTAVDA
ncbi:hypothetical protein ONZ45_g5538 [Pleurotus djamor]|nr:hypothetical protein ONZ45_g5538 [Pleurotus djamor]